MKVCVSNLEPSECRLAVISQFLGAPDTQVGYVNPNLMPMCAELSKLCSVNVNIQCTHTILIRQLIRQVT